MSTAMTHPLHDSLPAAMRALQASYRAVEQSQFRQRITGVRPMGSSHDFHIQTPYGYYGLIETARHLDRNNPYVGQAIDRVVQYVVGTQGMKLTPNTGDDDLDATLLDRWEQWSSTPEACDLSGRHHFRKIASLALRHMLVDGDAFSLLTKQGSVQLIPAHRAKTPTNTRRKVVHGVMVDLYRRPLEYWFTRDDIGTLQTIQRVHDMRRYMARDADGHRNVLHLFDPKRTDQTRGVTSFAAAIESSSMFDDIQFAQLVKAQIASCIAFIRETEFGTPGGEAAEMRYQASPTQYGTDAYSKSLKQLYPGLFLDGLPGDEFKTFSPNVPNAEFFQHATMVLSAVAINLKLPLVVLLMDATETNFSAYRAAFEQAKEGFKELQQWLIEELYTPVYQWQVRRWMASDARLAEYGPEIFRHQWRPRGWEYLEPVKDATADLLQVKGGMLSHETRMAKRGGEWNEESKRIVKSNAMIIRRALAEWDAIRGEFPEAGLDWRELIFGVHNESIKLAVNVGETKEPNSDGENEDGNTESSV
jgi:lambda family phage portal protein